MSGLTLVQVAPCVAIVRRMTPVANPGHAEAVELAGTLCGIREVVVEGGT